MTATVENTYLAGNFAPVTDERDDAELPVTGAIPPGLDGILLRNGPNPITPDPPSYHWFVGDGMLHGVELRDGAARYRNRWVRTDAACAALGEEPPAGQPADVFVGGSSVANTHVVAHAGRILALVEVSLPTEVRPDLTTVGRFDFDGALAIRDDRAPEDRPADRRDALLRLRRHGPAVPALPRGRRLGCARAHGSDHARRAGDGARLRDHPAVRRLARPAHRLRLRPAREAALPGEVDAGAPRPRRCDAA